MKRRYRIGVPTGVADTHPPPFAPTRVLQLTEWDFEEGDFDRIPELRRWAGDNRIHDMYEAGSVGDSEAVPRGAGLMSAVGTVQISDDLPDSVASRSEPCVDCGLLTTVVVDYPAVTLPRPLPDGCSMAYVLAIGGFVASADLVDAIEEAGLARGLATAPLEAPGEPVRLVWATERIAGPAYPYGPEACRACGRATTLSARGPVFCRPAFAFYLAFNRPGTRVDWMWSPVFGQLMPMVSRYAAEWLAERVAGIRFVRQGWYPDEEAFLPEEFR